jgi:hypothetical protein
VQHVRLEDTQEMDMVRVLIVPVDGTLLLMLEAALIVVQARTRTAPARPLHASHVPRVPILHKGAGAVARTVQLVGSPTPAPAAALTARLVSTPRPGLVCAQRVPLASTLVRERAVVRTVLLAGTPTLALEAAHTALRAPIPRPLVAARASRVPLVHTQ